MKKVLTDRLKILRGSRSQAEFAKEMGLAQQTYANWENGQREPDIEKIVKIALHNGVTVDWLVRGEGPDPKAESPPARDRKITDEDVSKIIDQNLKLSGAAEALGKAHGELMTINGELARELVEMCRESRGLKGCAPARDVKTGGGSATKTAS